MNEVKLEIERYTVEFNENIGWYKDKLEEAKNVSFKLEIDLRTNEEKSQQEIKN